MTWGPSCCHGCRDDPLRCVSSWRADGEGSPGGGVLSPGSGGALSRSPPSVPGAGGGPGGGGGRAAARRGADISRRRGLPASFFARCITSRRCHTPLPGAGLQPRLSPPRRAARLGGAGAHGVPARRGQPRLRRPPVLLEVSGAGAGARPRGNPAPDPPGRPWRCSHGQRVPQSPAAPRRRGGREGAGGWWPRVVRGGGEDGGFVHGKREAVARLGTQQE